MIVEQLKNWRHVFQGPAWTKAFQELARVTPNTPDGDYPVQDEDIVVKVQTVYTKQPEERKFESHQQFIDIQLVLSGTERMDWTPIEDLECVEAYKTETDCVFYKSIPKARASLTMQPGTFAVFFARDGHMLGLSANGDSQQVRKVVVKHRASLVDEPFTWR